jgi:hypothetical protein
MNVCTPNISWHGCDPVYSCAINPIDCKRLATAGMRGKKSTEQSIVPLFSFQVQSIFGISNGHLHNNQQFHLFHHLLVLI